MITLPHTHAENVWRHWWHTMMAPAQSRLPILPLDPEPGPPPAPQMLVSRSPRRARRAARAQEPRAARIRKPAKAKPEAAPQTAVEPPALTNWQSPELADWAKNLIGDPRNDAHTLEDLLDGIDDYFELFAKLKRACPGTYDYFARVGAPVALRNVKIWKGSIFRPTISNADQLPSMFGAFITRTKEEYRDDIIEDHPSLFDFQFFEKLRSKYATVAPPGTVIFRHNLLSLGREAEFSKEERKKFPWLYKQWGACWLVGILPDGSVRALPCYMAHYQDLPRGSNKTRRRHGPMQVCHSGMMIPPGLSEMGQEGTGPHEFVLRAFNIILALTASSLNGVQVTIQRNGTAMRVGLPIGNLKSFFVDRSPDATTGRRNQILQLRQPHLRRLANGKEIVVREHLRGSRYFTWRDCLVNLSAPGIHHIPVEDFDGSMVTDEDSDYAQLNKDDLVDGAYLGDVISANVWKRRKNPIRRGIPTQRYNVNPLIQTQQQMYPGWEEIVVEEDKAHQAYLNERDR